MSGDEMRVLTVRQPWAWAIIHGGKDVENRVRNIAGEYRGAVAIHVALTDAPMYDAIGTIREATGKPFGHETFMPANRGHIIGVVDLIGAHQGTVVDRDRFVRVLSCFQPGKPYGLCSPWAQHNAVHLELANPRALKEPIPFKGALGLRKLDPETVAQVLAGVA